MKQDSQMRKRSSKMIDLEELTEDSDNLAATISVFYDKWKDRLPVDEDHPQAEQIKEMSEKFFESLSNVNTDII
jgi:asparagine synthetase A